ncbi:MULTISPECIES: phospholipase D-like domain-containing protein [unclassified Streptomyces]|uniref:phospholipase D-like domain-containing protein n=1 Tax=unclassified Streptomyces TaxID=2593676 RepID=UPI002E352219|nr:phospholipase D-like domain-containing protein [Streptomyces sp. NBC_01268]
MRRPVRLVLTLAAAVGLLAASPAPAGADTTAVTTTATFNDPSGDAAAQDRVRDHIIGLIDQTPAGATITAGLYTFTDDTVTDALGAAKNRGVNVRVVVDNTSVTMTGGEYTRLVARLGTDRAQGSWVFACPAGRGCIGSRQLPGDPDGAINHNKFWLFSNTGGANDVVVQTSANMTGVQRTDLFNNAVTIVDTGLYGIYQDYFADLLAYGTSATGLSHYYKTPASGPYKAYFFPRKEAAGTTYDNDASTDTVKLILDNVSCTGGTQIRMAANLFTRDEVATKLVALKNAGCSVILAHDGAPGSMGAGVESIVSGKLTQRVECYEDRGTGVAKAGLHSKYLLIEGTYDGVAGRKLVWTGSHNYTYPALRANDETLLKIDDPALYAQFKANHQYLMTYCAGS